MNLSHSPKSKSHPELIERAKALVSGILRQLNMTPVRADKIYAALVAKLKDEGAADQAIRQLIDDGMLEAEVPVADKSSDPLDRIADKFLVLGPVPLNRIYVKATDLLRESSLEREESSLSTVGANTPKNGDGIPASVSKPSKSSDGQTSEAERMSLGGKDAKLTDDVSGEEIKHPPDDIAKLEAETPSFEKDTCEWVKNKKAADLEGVETRTLSTYRKTGIKNNDSTLGRDPDGRIWRRPGTPSSHPWYLRNSLKSNSGG